MTTGAVCSQALICGCFCKRYVARMRFALAAIAIISVAPVPATASDYALVTARGEVSLQGASPIRDRRIHSAVGSSDASYMCFGDGYLFVRAGSRFYALNGLARGIARMSAIRAGVWMREIEIPEAGTTFDDLVNGMIRPGIDAACR